MEEKISPQLKYQRLHKELGLCTKCSQPVMEGSILCEKHKAYEIKSRNVNQEWAPGRPGRPPKLLEKEVKWEMIMPRAKLALELLQIGDKIDRFLCEMDEKGLDLSNTALNQINIPELVARTLGVDPKREDFVRVVWDAYALTDSTDESMKAFIEAMKNA